MNKYVKAFKESCRKLEESILTEYSQEAVDKARDINKQISIDLINVGYPAFWIKNLINR